MMILKTPNQHPSKIGNNLITEGRKITYWRGVGCGVATSSGGKKEEVDQKKKKEGGG